MRPIGSAPARLRDVRNGGGTARSTAADGMRGPSGEGERPASRPRAVNEQPFFSVIVPTHRRAHLLERALKSIKAQESPASCEAIVVSDVADKATEAVCNALLGPDDMFIRRNGPPGPSASRNVALGLARGRYVLFLDDDDAWHPGLLADLAGCDAVGRGLPLHFDCTVVKERRLKTKTEILGEMPLDLAGALSPQIYVKNRIHMSCFAFPRHALQGLAFDPHMRAYEDWDFLLSVIDRGMPVHVPFCGSRVFEVDDETTDRRGSSRNATDFNAVLDYLYVYRRHPAPTPELKEERAALFRLLGLAIPAETL